MKTLTSFQPLLDRCAEYDQFKHDTVLQTTRLQFSEDGNLTVPSDMGVMSLRLEDKALSQLAARLGTAFWDTPNRTIPNDYFRHLNHAWPQHFAALTNDLLQKKEGETLVRGYDDRVRAILSTDYTTLDNSTLLDMAAQILGTLPYEIIESGNYYRDNDGVQRDEMSVRVVVKNVLPPDEQSGYGLGFLLRNGETGGGSSEIRPLVMRTSCMNSLVFKRSEDGLPMGLRLTHRGQMTAKTILMGAAIAEAIPAAEDGLARFLALREHKIDLGAVIANLGKEHNWSEEMRLTIGVGSEGKDSLFGLVNGMTYAAHHMDIDQTARVDLESMAGVLVHNPQLAR